MNPYTVVLLHPEFLCDEEPYGQDVYVAFVKAESEYEAVPLAQAEACEEDLKRRETPSSSPEDYAVVLVFEGHITPKLWGWVL